MKEERFNPVNRMLASFKASSILFPPNTPHYAMCTNLHKAILRYWLNWSCHEHNNSTTFCGITHWIPNKLNTIDHNSYYRAMKKQMIYQFPTFFGQTTAVYDHSSPLLKIIYRQNFTQGSWTWKESHPRRDLCLPHHFPREWCDGKRG